MTPAEMIRFYERHTKTQVVLSDGSRFRPVVHGYNGVPSYEQVPKYIDYRTVLEPVSEEAS